MQPSRRDPDPQQRYMMYSGGSSVSQASRSQQRHTESHGYEGQQHHNPSPATSRNHTGLRSFATREHELFGNQQDHRFYDFQQPRSPYFATLSTGPPVSHRVSRDDRYDDSSPFSSSVVPLPRHYGDRLSGVRHREEEHHHLRSQSFDGFMDSHGRQVINSDQVETQSLTRHSPYTRHGSVSSPSTSISDADVASDPDGQSSIEQETEEETKSSFPSKSQAKRDQPAQATAKTTTKSSRYLREMDRRTILWRLANGEKQAALAKEFHVSRSTICNLYKQRQVVWARHDENPMSLHPKKSRRKALSSSAKASSETRSPSVDSPMEDKESSDLEVEKPQREVEGSVLEVKSRALSLLLTTIRNHETSHAHYQRCCSRAMRLLLEESLIVNDQTSGGVEPPRPLYAISLERHANVVLETFHDIEPESPSMEFWPPFSGHRRPRDSHKASDSLENYDVVLLDMATTSAELVRTAIRTLRGCGVQESRLSLVSLFVSDDVVTRIVQEHPLVRIFTASIDPAYHYEPKPSKFELESASRMFLERFHTIEV